MTDIRYDLRVIASWIEPGSKALDLGCGEGALLRFLKKEKGVTGTGIEADEAKVAKCIESGLSVVMGDINEELEAYPENMFDYVILSLTLQQVYNPDEVIRSILRIGKRAIVSFPNFSHWRVRTQLLLTGYAPKTRQLPYEWYNTPNIRVITLKDFRKFSRKIGFYILKEIAVNTNSGDRKGEDVRFLPDLRATHGIFLIGKGPGGVVE